MLESLQMTNCSNQMKFLAFTTSRPRQTKPLSETQKEQRLSNVQHCVRRSTAPIENEGIK